MNGEPSLQQAPDGQTSFKITPGPAAPLPQVFLCFFFFTRCVQQPGWGSPSRASACPLCPASSANGGLLSARVRLCHSTKGPGGYASKCVLLQVSMGTGPAGGEPELFTCEREAGGMLQACVIYSTLNAASAGKNCSEAGLMHVVSQSLCSPQTPVLQ